MVLEVNKSNNRVYHLVQSNFFAHHHFHKNKINALSRIGLNASILSVVPKSLYEKRRKDFDIMVAKGDVELIIVPSKLTANLYLFTFLLKALIKNNKVLIHILRSWTLPAVIFKFLPFVRKRLIYVQEFEGDNHSEFIYESEYIERPRPAEKSSSKFNQLKSHLILIVEKIKVRKADGMVLMSDEHSKLWSSRLGGAIRATILPTLADPKSIRFDKSKRILVRDQLSLRDKTVLAYVGNVVCMWQRRDAMCKLISVLCKQDNQFHFLAIVRREDLALMKASIKKFDIEEHTTLLNVEHKEIYKYLSAADLGLFLRHDHTMNKVVTSGKLIEFLTAGLPLITTGNNAEFLNEFIRKNKSGFFIDDTLEISTPLMEFLSTISSNKDKAPIRETIRNKVKEEFYAEANGYRKYARFIEKLLDG